MVDHFAERNFLGYEDVLIRVRSSFLLHAPTALDVALVAIWTTVLVVGAAVGIWIRTTT